MQELTHLSSSTRLHDDSALSLHPVLGRRSSILLSKDHKRNRLVYIQGIVYSACINKGVSHREGLDL